MRKYINALLLGGTQTRLDSTLAHTRFRLQITTIAYEHVLTLVALLIQAKLIQLIIERNRFVSGINARIADHSKIKPITRI